MPHDNSYKLLFSRTEMVRDLIVGFVHKDWVRLLDFTTLGKVSGSYVSDELRDREDDLPARAPELDDISVTAGWRQPGFTLTEMLVVVIIIAILAVVAIPSFQDYFEKARLKHAAENIHSLILQAKAEGPIRDQNISLSINPDSWCLGFSTNPGCDCSAVSGANACTIDVAGVSVRQTLSGDEFPGVTITHTFPGNGATFNRLRKTASPAGTIKIHASRSSLDVRVGVSGRVRICTPNGSAAGAYPAC